MASKGSEASIDIFLRIRPVNKPSNRVTVDNFENKVEFNIPKSESAGIINNQREHYEFRFNGILTAEAKQDEVFERIARNVVTGAIEGFNGTIFAYGQTGSGKTFTITGGAERYVDRGIIPRTISAIFSEVNKRSDFQYQIEIAYLEIYNEIGYDLLDPNRVVKAMEDLPQVHILEDEDKQIHFRNLSIHRANNEEEALNLLFLGDTNRTISETPMNQASSRSHCIFTIYIEARKVGEDLVRRSKLNLVDLAGSERVSKTGVDGTTLQEAKFINLSLHYLEQVIIALQERSMGINRPHIPYRNSLMTTVLRDSLGGNCRTVMVATMSSQQDQLDESISTCRFAQRVAMVRNAVILNEELDPSALIRRLKGEVRELKEEIRLLRGEADERGPLTPDEVERLKRQVETYVADTSGGSSLSLGGSMMMINAVFNIFKDLIRMGGGLARVESNGSSNGGATPPALASGGAALNEMTEQLRKLKLQVAQRDQEINILVSMLQRKEKAGGGGGQNGVSPATSGPTLLQRPAGPPPDSAVPSTSSSVSTSADLTALMNTNLLADRNQAFELFRKSYRQNEVIEENKALLKKKYDVAKTLGSTVNDSKERITELRSAIEERRRQRGIAGVVDGEQPDVDDPEEIQFKDMIEQEKAKYKTSFNELRDLKKEIDHLHMLLEQSRARLQRDFEQWMELMARQQQGGTAAGSGSVSANMSSSVNMTPKSSNSPQVPSQRSSTNLPIGPSKVAWGDPQAQPPAPVAASRPANLLASVDPAVLEAARPHLTGVEEADIEIIRFYEARAKCYQNLSVPAA